MYALVGFKRGVGNLEYFPYRPRYTHMLLVHRVSYCVYVKVVKNAISNVITQCRLENVIVRVLVREKNNNPFTCTSMCLKSFWER